MLLLCVLLLPLVTYEQKLQLAQGMEAEKARQLTLDHYIRQVRSTAVCGIPQQHQHV